MCYYEVESKLPSSGRFGSSNMFLLDCSSLVCLPLASLIVHLFSMNLLILRYCSLFRFLAASHHIYKYSCFIYENHSRLCSTYYFEEFLIPRGAEIYIS